MRDLLGLLCVCALAMVPLVGCFDLDIFDNPCDGVDCNDLNACTLDDCKLSWGLSPWCDHDPVDDGKRCSRNGVAGMCVDGVCSLCEGVVCADDGNACTYDCNPATGTCDYVPVWQGSECDDGDDNECAHDTCIDGACIGDGAWMDNGTVCSFDDFSGVCVEGVCGENLCEDGCDDGNACTDDACDYVDGACDYTPAVCDDSSPCTDDTCEPVDGCIFTAVEDGTQCDWSSMCQAGDCVVPCDPATEEVYQCPIQGFEDQMCCPGSEYCGDEYNCGLVVCDPASEEVLQCPIGGLEDLVCCPDVYRCQDVCCESPEDCDDGNSCREHACADGFCEYTPLADGTACGNDAGACQAGSCVGTFACTEQGIRDAIAVGGGPHTFDCGGPKTVVTQGTIEVGNDVILDGEGNLTVHANDRHRVFTVWNDMRAELRGVTITGGASQDEYGGGIRAFGPLKLMNCTVAGNSAFRYGGGIVTQAKLELTNSTVWGNSAGRYGGGIANYGALIITNSTVSYNFAAEGGGGIYKDDTLPIHMLTVTNSTVSDNASDSGSSGVFGSGMARMTNTLVDDDCSWSGEIVSGGHNIESPGHTCGFDQATDRVNVTEDQLKLGPLLDNGGATETHALGAGSVAVDVIPEAECLDAEGEALTEDQRGEPRPAGAESKCDVGAFELQP